MEMSTLPIRPEEHAERAALRGCHNCSAYSAPLCRKGAPGPHGWPTVAANDWCEQWTWIINPRVTWATAIAPAERNR